MNHSCPVCSKWLYDYWYKTGRPSVYCSDACKMVAYRQRKKALRNTQQVCHNSV